MDLREYIAPDLLEKFEFYSYNHALEIITQAFPAEWSEIVDLSLIHISEPTRPY